MTNWTAIVPVRPWGLAEENLGHGRLSGCQVAQAMCLDVIETILATPGVQRIIVVSTQLGLARLAPPARMTIVADRPLLAADPVNDAVRLGLGRAQRFAPSDPVVIVPADMAVLDPDALEGTLAKLKVHPIASVPDFSGRGASLMSAATPDIMQLGRGRRSAAWLTAPGAAHLTDVDPRARLDVDTWSDLQAAAQLGVRARTAALIGTTSRVRTRSRP